MKIPTTQEKAGKNRKFSIVFDFTWSGKVRYERGIHSRVFIFLFVIVWVLDDSFLEYLKRVGKEPKLPGKERFN